MTSTNRVLAALAAAGALALVGVAHAASVEPDAVVDAIDEAGAGGDIAVTVDDEGVAKLSGVVDEPNDGMVAVNAARQVPGVTRVVDLLRSDD